MTFNDDANYSGKGVRKSGRRTGLAVGGGGIGLVAIVLLSQLLGVDLSGLLGGGTETGGQGEDTALTNCETGVEANASAECRVGLTRDSLEDYWVEQAPAMGISYASPTIVLFTDGVDTGCGSATSAVGPFYCPADQQIYLDTAFYDTLRSQFGATAGPLSQLYVVGHEWGHHIQNLAGTFASADTSQTGPASDAQLADALNAASAIGDDRIQEKTQGQVNPETWTHGSSEMRQKWFQAGYTGGAQACDTFATADADL
jgi:predicted metalloprotease